MISPQLHKEVESILSESKPTNKLIVRALNAIQLLLNQDVCIAKHLLNHLITLLKQ